MNLPQSQLQNEKFLTEFRTFWLEICRAMQNVRDIFHYMERTTNIGQDEGLWEYALNLIRCKLTLEVKKNLIEQVLGIIEKNRQQIQVDKDLISKMVHVMLALEFYKGDP